MSAPGVVVQSLVVALVPRSSLKHVVPLKNGSQPMAMEIVPKKPQIRSCLVFKPSILRTNILNGIPPGKIQMSSKKTTILKGEISSLQASTFRWYVFVFGGGKRVKFTMSTRPEPLPVSSWARPPGKKHIKKVGSSDERIESGIPGVIGRDPYIILWENCHALYTKLQVYVTSMYMNGNLWGAGVMLGKLRSPIHLVDS